MISVAVKLFTCSFTAYQHGLAFFKLFYRGVVCIVMSVCLACPSWPPSQKNSRVKSIIIEVGEGARSNIDNYYLASVKCLIL